MNRTYRYLTYKKKDGTCIDIRVSNEDNECWLTVDEIAALYNKNVKSLYRLINTLNNTKNDKEPSGQNLPGSPLNNVQKMHLITPNSSQKVRIIQENHDKKLRRPPTIYNSKIIIEIGYRIRSNEGLKLKEFLDSQNAIIL